MRTLVNIRGTNGSGKSTFPISMQDMSADHEQISFYVGEDKSYITVLHDLKWVLLGKYSGSKTGGLDTLRSNAVIKATLYKALDEYPDYNILMEGIICSTIRSTYISLFTEVKESYDIKVVVIGLTTPLQTCLDRIQERNGGKPIKEELVAAKERMIHRGFPYFDEAGFRVVRIDTSKYSKAKMIEKFLRAYGG